MRLINAGHSRQKKIQSWKQQQRQLFIKLGLYWFPTGIVRCVNVFWCHSEGRPVNVNSHWFPGGPCESATSGVDVGMGGGDCIRSSNGLTCLTVYTLMRLDGRVGRLQTVKTQHGSVFMPTGHGAKTEPRHNCEFLTACLRLFTEARGFAGETVKVGGGFSRVGGAGD